MFRNSLQNSIRLYKTRDLQSLVCGENLYEVLTKFTLTLLAVLIPYLSFDFGITWDERMSIQYSSDMLRYFATSGLDKTCLDQSIPLYNHMIYYGNIFGMLSNLLQKILPLDIIQTRHLLCSVFGFLTIFYISRHARLLHGYRLAFLTIVLLVFSPRFTGYIMNDFRDTTFMLGFVASTYYFHHVLRRLPEWSWYIAFKAAMAVFLASAVRIGGMVLLLLFALYILIYLWKRRGEGVRSILLPASLQWLFIALLSYALTVAAWPWAHQAVFTGPIDALLKFSKLRLMLNYQMFKGELIPNIDVPWDFLFTWIGITTPLVVLLGLAFSFTLLGRRRSVAGSELMIPLLAMLIPLLFYLFRVRNIYDGWRHFLFLAPYFTLFSALGWSQLLSLIKMFKIRAFIALSLLVLLFLPVRMMALRHPLHTLYFNELIGGIEGAYGEFELEMDGNSLRPATEWLNDYARNNGISHIKLASNHGGLSISYFAKPSLIDGDPIWLSLDHTFIEDWDFAILSTRTLSRHRIRTGQWPYKSSIHEVMVGGVPVVSILKRQDKNLYYGVEKLKTGDLDGAIRNFEAARQNDPGLEDNPRLLGIAYMQKGQYEKAEKALNSAVKLDPTNVSLLYYIGELAYNKGDFQRALDYLERSKVVRLDNYRADYLIAKVYVRQNRMNEALERYENLVARSDLNPGDRSLICMGYGELKMILAQRENGEGKRKLVNEAIALFEEAINADRRNRMAYLNLSEVYKYIGMNKEADKVLDIMKTHSPVTEDGK